MNSTQKISCPNCHTEISLDKALSAQIEADLKSKFQADFNQKQKELEQRATQIEQQNKDLEKSLHEKLEQEKRQMWIIAQREAEKKAQENSNLKLQSLEQELQERTKKQRELEMKELEYAKKVREIESQKQSLELEFEKKFLNKAKEIEESAKIAASQESEFKLKEKEMQMDQMRRTIEELRRKSEQGSMQVQGDMQEHALKEILAAAFVIDEILDVPTGIKGADLIQKVRSEFGEDSGTIIWESKNTKSWNADWIRKLKQDQAEAKADVAILASKVLPDGATGCVNLDGVWVVEIKFALMVARVVRSSLLQVHRVKQSLVGTDQKMEYLHRYLTGSQFKNRIENIVIAFKAMQEDLDKEKRLFQKHWAKREKEIEMVTTNTIGLYGDLQGLMGTSLQKVEALELDSGDL